MPDYSIYLIIFFSILILWFVFYKYYSKRHRNFIKSFIDSNNHITIIANEKSIFSINKKGLEFFGLLKTEDFIAKHAGIANLFLNEQGCIDKYFYGKDWIEKVEKTTNKKIKVKMLTTEKKFEYFHIQISKLNFANYYLLSFDNITHLENEKTRIQELAEFDPLTKVYNRVKVNEVFEEFIYKVNKYGGAFSIVLLDIDHFKAINDTHGHNVGDKVLFELARLVHIGLRKDDVFARWGGEEFIILANNSTLHDTKILASRVRADIENYNFFKVKKITCSLGVTEFKAGDTEMLMLERVDLALYEAKEAGRNKVVAK